MQRMLVVAAGMLIFALVHTALAGQAGKQAFRARFGDRAYHGLYRISYNLLSLLLLAPVLFYIWWQGRVIWVIPDEYELLLLALQAVGLLGVAAALLQADLWDFLGLRQAVAYLRGDTLPLPPPPLATNGVYALVRHPLYLFALLVIWPVTAMTDLLLVFNLAATAYFLIGSRWEEKRLLAAYGEAYDSYRRRVPWLLPLPRPRK